MLPAQDVELLSIKEAASLPEDDIKAQERAIMEREERERETSHEIREGH